MTAPLLSLQGLCKHYPLGTRLFHAPQVVRAVQDKLLERTQELDLEFHEDEFPYWRRRSAGTRRR